MLSELRPGVVHVEMEDGASEKYFIPGGFAFTHANGTLDISAPEGCKLDDIDVEQFKKCALRALNISMDARVSIVAGLGAWV